MSRMPTLVLLSLSLLLWLPGCSQQNESSIGDKGKAVDGKQAASRVVVPETVSERWKAVKISVSDRETRQDEIYTVDIGHEFQLAESKVTMKVASFLPAFVMAGSTMTSASANPENPAVEVVVKEDGVEVFRGWLFSLYPEARAIQHPRFTFALVDFVPTVKKGLTNQVN
ncbi:MAG: DUF2155 domain-containing protein [Trichloromonadaceae bacterium]